VPSSQTRHFCRDDKKRHSDRFQYSPTPLHATTSSMNMKSYPDSFIIFDMTRILSA
jgi:hypothetical protein